MYLFRRRISEEHKQAHIRNRRVHLANERTFLAWIRTSIGIMAFGFVIEKFVVPLFQDKTAGIKYITDGYNWPAFLGIFLVFLGAIAGLLATYRFIKTEKEIMENTFRPSVTADILIASVLGCIAILLVIYLITAL